MIKSEFETILSKSIDRRILRITYQSGVVVQGWIINYNPNTHPATVLLVVDQEEEHHVDLAGIKSIEIVPSPKQV